MVAMMALARPEGGNKRLDRIKGTVGFATGPDASLHEVFGHDVLPDDDYAITKALSAAQVILPDSSIVALGENTKVRVGAFTAGTDGPGSTIAVDGGTLRFDIHRPEGGAANYRFTTTTSQIAVRGTVGLLSFLGGNTTVACLVCAADSVTITAGSQTIALAAGQFVTISATGALVTGTISSTVLSTFSSAQVSTVAASGSSAAASGVASAGLTGSVAGSTVAAAAAGAAVVGVTVTAVTAKSTPAPTPAPTATPTATPTPSASPTPNAPIQIQKVDPPAARPTAGPVSAPPAAPAAPPAIGPELPGHRGTH